MNARIPARPMTEPSRRAAFEEVRALVRRIPAGRVTTYGRLARAVSGSGRRLSARAAGWALRHSPDDVPWHRVVNAQGVLSAERSGNCPPGRQRLLLVAEGVAFDRRGRVLLERFLFDPPAPDARPAPEE